MSLTVPLLPDLSVVPVFKYITYEDLLESEQAGHAVHKTIAAVEVRYSGNNGRSYAPVFPADAIWKREGHRSITYAERWAKEYQDFLQGNSQTANGTPLENLRPYGVTEAMLSMCRALRVYSIESLMSLDGGTGKSLGMFSNILMDMARKWAEERNGAGNDEVAALRAELDALKASMSAPAPVAATDEDAEKKALKARYFELTKKNAQGNPNVESLRQMVQIAEGGRA